jgi:two-component system, OmpR family, phosphate regulon response regulator PhoB
VSAVVATVLLCDDEEVLRQLVRATLDNGEYSIVEATDGDESLELARRLRPDLIVLDMMMPGRSGLEVLQELRGDPNLGSTPVIMLTARARQADREAAAAAGADRYLAKPFSPLELISLVEELLEGGGAPLAR